MALERINKYLAACGKCSRREADRLIAEGRVSINGRMALSGDKVSEEDSVCLDTKPVQRLNQKVVLAYYKPVGVTCTEKDRHAERMVTEEINYPVRVTYAGRLDRDSEGLLLLSNDGELIQRITKACNCHEKEYVVKLQREVTPAFLEKMQNGVWLSDLEIKTRRCKVWQEGKNTFHIVLTQGVNRQIRRMCRELGFHVAALKRIRVVNITLENLKPGEYRELTGKELDELYRITGMEKSGIDRKGSISNERTGRKAETHKRVD